MLRAVVGTGRPRGDDDADVVVGGPLALMMMLALLTAGQLVLMMAAIAWLVFYSAAFLPCQSQSRLNLFVYLVLLFL